MTNREFAEKALALCIVHLGRKEFVKQTVDNLGLLTINDLILRMTEDNENVMSFVTSFTEDPDHYSNIY